MTSEDKVIPLQGPNSKYVKYTDVLCAPCNNQRTQRADRSYDQFIEYAEKNKDEILARRQISFREVYGSSWRAQQLELFRYFTKAFGCRIADSGREVPDDLVAIMSQDIFQTALWVCVAINDDALLLTPEDQKILRLGHLISNEPTQYGARYASAYFYRWLVFSYWYGWGPYGPVGERWCADLEFLCLGSYTRRESATDVCREDGTTIPWLGFET